MRRHIGIICVVISVLILLSAAVPGTAFCADADGSDVQELVFDISCLDDDTAAGKYARQFDGADVKMVISGDEVDRIPLLRQFDFHSLELQIEFDDKQSCDEMKPVKELLFPESLIAVNILCGGKPYFSESDAMVNFIISLWVCCPDAKYNGQPVSKPAAYVMKNDKIQMTPVYESNARMNLLFERAMNGELETIEGDPFYYYRLIFMIYGDSGLSSSESLAAGETFFGIPKYCLAESFEEAQTAVFIYPVTSVAGTYANGGEAVRTLTNVLVVDLESMKMYEPFTAVKNDPPYSIEVSTEEGIYPGRGAAGEYEPETALKQITDSGRIMTRRKAAEEETKDSEKSTGREAASGADAENGNTEKKPDDADQEGQVILAAPDKTEEEQKKKDISGPESSDKKRDARDVLTMSVWLDEEVRNEIFDILEDDIYRETYEGLKTSKDLVKGSKGDLVQGLQETLAAAGQETEADAVFGNDTLNCVNRVLYAFNNQEVTKVSSEVYSKILPAVLMAQKAEQARGLIERIFNDPEDVYGYLEGCLMYSQENYYQARTAFESIGMEGAQSWALDCVMDMPDSGLLYRNEEIEGDDSSLAVQINEEDEAAVTCIIIYTEDNETAAALILRGSGNAGTTLPPGKYRVMKATGYRWYGMNDLFGEEGDYEQLIFDDGQEYLRIEKGYDYSIRFNPGEHSSASVSLGAQDISWEDAASGQ